MESDLTFIIGAFSFGLGACIASFLNVVIWRMPRGESLVSPPSHCPKCNARIKWHQNIPILSWLALRGKCANCREPISPRYVLVEMLGGCLFLAAFLHLVPEIDLLFRRTPLDFYPWLRLLAWWIWISFMIVGSFIDFDHQLLPDFTTLGGMILGLALAVADSVSRGNLRPVLWSASGAAVGVSLLWLIRFFGSKAFKREAMGLGDVFLMGAVGALFGPVAVLVTLILSSFVGSIAGVGMVVLSKTKFGRFVEIPYGPHICLGCLGWMFWGAELVRWYMNLLRP